MKHAFDAHQLVIARHALEVLIAGYREIAEKENIANERKNLNAFADAGGTMLTRFGNINGSGELDLTPGDVSMLERAYRMAVAKLQSNVTATMSPDQKARFRLGADRVAAELSRLRVAKGLPW